MSDVSQLTAPAEPEPLLLKASLEQISWLIERKKELLGCKELTPRQRYVLYLLENLLSGLSAGVYPAEVWFDILEFEPDADEQSFWEAVRVIRRVLDHTAHLAKAS